MQNRQNQQNSRLRLRKTSKFISGIAAGCLALSVFSVSVTASASPYHKDEDTRPYSRKKCPDPETQAQVSQTNAPGANQGGDWTDPTSERYAVAKKLFDTMTLTYGTSGAFAAGVVGDLVGESTFVEDIAESYDSKNARQSRETEGVQSVSAHPLRFGMNNKQPVIGMAKYDGSMKGGGGLFQFTPFTKFTDSPFWGKIDASAGWSAANQIAYVMEVDVFSRTIEKYMTSTKKSYGAAHYGKPVRFTTVEQLISADDPRIAAEAFYVGQLRGAVYHPEREDHAAKAFALFNGASIKADPSKWVFSNGNQTNAVDVNKKDQSQQNEDDECKPDSLSLGLNWQDFTGQHGFEPLTRDKYFKYNELPENLKQFAINPEAFGFTWGNCAGWTQWTTTTDFYLNGQCVALSKVLFHSIWLKNGKSGPVFRGNGNVLAPHAAEAYGGSVSNIPSKGAISSVKSGSPYGHTYIVSHVFQNGDILITEQNVGGYSGNMNGGQCEWSYRIEPKDSYTRDGAVFYNPAPQGYLPDPRLTSATSVSAPSDKPSETPAP